MAAWASPNCLACRSGSSESRRTDNCSAGRSAAARRPRRHKDWWHDAAGPAAGAAAARPCPCRRPTLAYPTGAIVDTVGRRMAEQLGNALGSNVVVENRGGTGGNLAAAYVARATPDGHTLLFTSYGNLIIAAAANLQLGFHPWRDLAPVGMIGPMTVVLLVRPDFPAQTLQDFVRHVGAHPGTVNFASVGFGSSYHLLIE